MDDTGCSCLVGSSSWKSIFSNWFNVPADIEYAVGHPLVSGKGVFLFLGALLDGDAGKIPVYWLCFETKVCTKLAILDPTHFTYGMPVLLPPRSSDAGEDCQPADFNVLCTSLYGAIEIECYSLRTGQRLWNLRTSTIARALYPSPEPLSLVIPMSCVSEPVGDECFALVSRTRLAGGSVMSIVSFSASTGTPLRIVRPFHQFDDFFTPASLYICTHGGFSKLILTQKTARYSIMYPLHGGEPERIHIVQTRGQTADFAAVGPIDPESGFFCLSLDTLYAATSITVLYHLDHRAPNGSLMSLGSMETRLRDVDCTFLCGSVVYMLCKKHHILYTVDLAERDTKPACAAVAC